MTKGHFEAKKHGYRQTADGIVISFVIHPNDVDKNFAVAPLGTPYMLGWAEIDPDTSQPAKATQQAPQLDPKVVQQALQTADEPVTQIWDDGTLEVARKPKRQWSELSRAEQAGIACNDPGFRDWMVGGETLWGGKWHEATVEAVRQNCGIDSRAELNTDEVAGRLWNELYGRYDAERRGMMR